MVRITVKTGQSSSPAVICRKRSSLDMQFHLVVPRSSANLLKTSVEDSGDSRLLERRISFVFTEALVLPVYKFKSNSCRS